MTETPPVPTQENPLGTQADIKNADGGYIGVAAPAQFGEGDESAAGIPNEPDSVILDMQRDDNPLHDPDYNPFMDSFTDDPPTTEPGATLYDHLMTTPVPEIILAKAMRAAGDTNRATLVAMYADIQHDMAIAVLERRKQALSI